MTKWEDPNGQNEKLKVCKALIVWSDNKTKLSDIYRFFLLTWALRREHTKCLGFRISRLHRRFGSSTEDLLGEKIECLRQEPQMGDEYGFGQSTQIHFHYIFVSTIWGNRLKNLIYSTYALLLLMLPKPCMCCIDDFKYQMINKFMSIDNTCYKQKYNELKGEIYLITSSYAVWTKW